MLRKLALGVVTGLAILATANFTHAEATASDDPGPFAKGNWTLSLYGGYIQNFGGRTARIGDATAGVGYYLKDNLSLDLELSGYAISLRDQSAFAVSPALLLRYHFYNTGPWSLFGEVRGGLLEADHEVPSDGTHFNFTFEPGGGVLCRLSEKTYLMVGARYFHLSNGNTQSGHKNPSINGVEGYLGLMFRL